MTEFEFSGKDLIDRWGVTAIQFQGYPQRIAIVEPIYANIRTQKRLDRFTLRGKIKVNIQWVLYCMVHNMEKIINYGMA